MVKLVAEVLKATKPAYTPGLTREYAAQVSGLPVDDIAKLGSAENPFGPSPKASAAVDKARARIDQYPEWSSRDLREAIAKKYGFEADNVICGAGETEVISFLLRAYSRADDAVLMFAPCFPIYHIFSEHEARRPEYVPLGADLTIDIDAYIEKLEEVNPAVAFVTNPHSPTGKLIAEADLRRIADASRGTDTLLVLDEAYIHFTETAGGMHLTREYDNLIVLRTFSKAFGLAGLRLGFGIAANADLITPLRNIKPTWNVGCLQTAGGIAAVTDDEHVNRTVAAIVEMRDYATSELRGLNRFRMVPDSRSNFYMIEITDPALDSTIVFNSLVKKGVIVKDCSIDFVGLGNRYLRCDVGLKKHTDRLVAALREIDAQGA